jgi:hypothetical protein
MENWDMVKRYETAYDELTSILHEMGLGKETPDAGRLVAQYQKLFRALRSITLWHKRMATDGDGVHEARLRYWATVRVNLYQNFSSLDGSISATCAQASLDAGSEESVAIRKPPSMSGQDFMSVLDRELTAYVGCCGAFGENWSRMYRYETALKELQVILGTKEQGLQTVSREQTVVCFQKLFRALRSIALWHGQERRTKVDDVNRLVYWRKVRLTCLQEYSKWTEVSGSSTSSLPKQEKTQLANGSSHNDSGDRGYSTCYGKQKQNRKRKYEAACGLCSGSDCFATVASPVRKMRNGTWRVGKVIRAIDADSAEVEYFDGVRETMSYKELHDAADAYYSPPIGVRICTLTSPPVNEWRCGQVVGKVDNACRILFDGGKSVLMRDGAVASAADDYAEFGQFDNDGKHIAMF